jgi:hypothetical protein
MTIEQLEKVAKKLANSDLVSDLIVQARQTPILDKGKNGQVLSVLRKEVLRRISGNA